MLSPAERVRSIRSLLSAGRFLLSKSPKAAWAKQYADEQKLLERRNIRDFIARHER